MDYSSRREFSHFFGIIREKHNKVHAREFCLRSLPKLAYICSPMDEMKDKLKAVLDGLNEEQKKAVCAVDGPVLIVAGAGSGKTRVLTSRVAYMLAMGTDPSRILALTFTKKAAGEMKERIALMVGARSARRVVMGTFHSVFVRFLREYAGFLGYPEQFTIYDASDQASAMKACIKELQLDDKIYKPREVLSRISLAKNNLMTVSAYRNNPQIAMEDSHSRKPRIGELYELYQRKLKQSGVMDFDDILLNMNILLRDNPDALRDISGRFDYIMVDEYQDTNHAQYIIIRKLAVHRNICVVGDDSQSIYAFRGAKIENILNFKKDYKDCKTYRLERNYRSTATIVDAANSLISHYAGRNPKDCYATGDKGDPIKIIHAYTEGEEAVQIVSEITRLMRMESAQYEDFAILYRTNSQSRALEEQLRRRNIPYMIYSGNSFFERAEVKDMMAYFKLVVNVNDDEAFRRIVNKPARGIGDTTLAALATAAQVRGTSFFKAIFLDDLESFGLKNSAVTKLKAFAQMIDKLAMMCPTTDAFVLAQRIADDSGLYAFFKADNSIEGQSRTSNVEELINSVQGFIEERMEEAADYAEENGQEPEKLLFTLDDYLENVSLLSNVDVADDEDTNNKVALMTVHSAKGLEYPYVFVSGLEEDLFPSGGFMAGPQDIEEERRLFYVALTRAKRNVFLSYADSRMRNGKHNENTPSRFIREIDSKYIENPLDDSAFRSSGGSRAVWGGFPSVHRGSGTGYGESSEVRFIRRPQQPSGLPERPRTQYTSRPMSNGAQPQRPAMPAKPEIIDPDFVAVPMTELFVGERIEHNRFGGGLILDITGTAPEMKARIKFDDYGEKLLLLKYAKLRPEKKG